MRDSWRLSGIAVAFLVLLRMAIGWQFLYEGLWKLNTFSSAKPWTSAGYLRSARGPLRNAYRGMTGDPDDLRWLDYDEVTAGLDAYRNQFLAHNPDLSEDQQKQLDTMLEGPSQFSARLDHLPAGLKIEGNLKKVISFDPESKRLNVDGKMHLLPKERFDLEKQARALKNASAADVDRFIKALDQVFKLSAHLSYKERLAVLLKIDPERVGLVYRDDKTKEVVEERKGKITEYKELLSRYNEQLPRARQTFEIKHLDTQWDEIQKLRAELVTPVKVLETDFHQDARKLLTVEQLARGPVPEPWTAQQRIDHLTIWALIGLGCLLIAGFFSRTAALGGAALLLSFYLAVPPWPGVEDLESAGPEHSFLVNKNLIEVIALLAIVSMPTGRWLGLDQLISALAFRRRKSPPNN
ncbi:MAG TPA: hypothetical protein VFG04_20240 [Planctomycetaceae bacterium]|nr:hypothetical protein [Planctomycetaceae bacterium]